MIATTRGRLLRGTVEDEFGEQVEYNGPEVGHFVTIPTTYTPWAPYRRNLCYRPLGSLATSTVDYGIANGAILAFDPVLKGARISALIGGSIAAGLSLQGGIGYTPGIDIYTVSCDVTGVVEDAWRLSIQGSWIAGTSTGTPVNVPVGETRRLSRVFTSTAGARGNLYLLRNNTAVASEAIVTNVLFEKTATALPFFEGATPDTALVRHLWEGNVGASVSAEEIRSVDVPAYQEWIIDKASSDVPGVDPFPLSIIERPATEFDQASNQWRSIRKLVGRVSSRVPVNEGDRIVDTRDGKVYAVDGFVDTPRGMAGRSSVSLALRRTAP